MAAPGWKGQVYQQWDGGVTGFAKRGSLWTLPANTSTMQHSCLLQTNNILSQIVIDSHWI